MSYNYAAPYPIYYTMPLHLYQVVSWQSLYPQHFEYTHFPRKSGTATYWKTPETVYPAQTPYPFKDAYSVEATYPVNTTYAEDPTTNELPFCQHTPSCIRPPLHEDLRLQEQSGPVAGIQTGMTQGSTIAYRRRRNAR